MNGYQGFIVVGHGDEAEAFALVRLKVANDFDTLHGTKGAKELPEKRILRVRSQIVDEDAPAGTAVQGGICRNDGIGENVTGEW